MNYDKSGGIAKGHAVIPSHTPVQIAQEGAVLCGERGVFRGSAVALY